MQGLGVFNGLGQAYPMVSEGEMMVEEEPHYVHEATPVYVDPGRSTQTSPTTTTGTYCPIHPKMCLTSEAARKAAQDACRVPRVRGYNTRGGLRGLLGSLGRVCTIYDADHTVKVNDKMVTWWNPCFLKDLPSCETTFTPQLDPGPPPPPPEPEDEDNMFMVGGILAAILIAGGVGYAVMRKKKKGKRRK